MAIRKGINHEIFKGLDGTSRRDFIYYANLLKHNSRIANNVAVSPDACKQEVLNFLIRCTGDSRAEHKGWLNSCRNSNLLPGECFNWIEDSERTCCWAWGWLMTNYLNEPIINQDGSKSHPPITEFQNSLVTFPTDTKERLNSIVYFFDTQLYTLESKKQIIENMKSIWMSIMNNPHPLKFIDPLHEQQCAWAWEYLQKHGFSMPIFRPTNNKEEYLSAVASIDLNISHRDTKRIFLMSMKKACDQKKYREKLSGRKPLNTFINEDSKQKLDWLAKQRGQYINKTLEWLIDKEFDNHI